MKKFNNKAMLTGFDTDFRYLSDSDIIYNVCGKKKAITFDYRDYIEELTPEKKKFALSVIELYKRSHEMNRQNGKYTIQSSGDIYNYIYPNLCDLEYEECWVILLNQALDVTKNVKISAGGIASTAVDIRMVLKEALKNSSVAIILIHNHPSGNIKPSREDDLLTDRLNKAAKIMNIRLLDHLIFSDGKYYSYSDEGKL